MTTADFKPHQRVRYRPGIAGGDWTHPSCEDGAVSSANDKYVFVKFDKQLQRFGWDGTTSQSCDPEDLVRLPPIL